MPERQTMLDAGEGVTEISPPLGIELAGFHKPPGKERLITGVRQPCKARALVLRLNTTQVAIVSLDVCGFDADLAERVRTQAAKRTGIPAPQIRLTATHTHSAPTLRFFRQWGAVSKPYVDWVEQRAIQAIVAAKQDLAQADCYVGLQHVEGGNFNRTSKKWKTDEQFDKGATENDRWLDTTLHALYFLREKPKRSLLWYHFSAHPVCYTDGQAGPDWPGLVAEKMSERDGLEPSFLQGHCGDVNPGTGQTSLGDPEQVSEAVYAALHHALNHSTYVAVNHLRMIRSKVKMPLDIDRLKDQLERYRRDPAKCNQGEWVDAAFAKDWYESATRWNPHQTTYPAPLTALRLGQVALLLHPSELYSYYGLAIRRDSPFPVTLATGYADDFIGYVTDPAAHQASEYAAVVVPKILGLPPFKPEAGRVLSGAAIRLLKRLA